MDKFYCNDSYCYRRFWKIKEKSYITRKKWKYIILQVPFSLDYFVKVK